MTHFLILILSVHKGYSTTSSINSREANRGKRIVFSYDLLLYDQPSTQSPEQNLSILQVLFIVGLE